MDQALFHSVFGVVTWFACRKVQEHYNTTIKPYKQCTSTFTRVTGLPCTHVYNNRRDTTRFLPRDFHIHWFWDRGDIRVPYRDPVVVRPTVRNLQTARNTDRILSSFELAKQAEQVRTLPKCSACQGIGHKRNSRNCPINIRASMAEDSKRLREIELSQASIMPTTPRPTKRVRLEIPNSTSTHASAQSVMTTPLTLLYRTQTPENTVNSTTNIESLEAVLDIGLDAPKLPLPTF